ncbi:CinA family nicotinamide mononucleotide deamidase-related protein [Thalassotalea sp. PLHSN55]|uniref:CinA family nicotinamide mononucleotide deamidase-related protein n=1 Tax=Thalassotalea sp. PLHSN55 TaxID=3435888 RepID=UPI003F87283B
MSTLNVQLLLTGNELMSGDIIDSNSAMIAQQLKELGIELKRKVTVSDDMALLIDEIQQLSLQSDVIIVNGGLGPTVDDLTAQALAQAANVELEQHPDALIHLQDWCKNRGAALNNQNLKQAILPKGANVVANRTGSAVGFSLVLNDCEIICTPGVPPELKVMLSEQIIPSLSHRLPSNLKTHVTRMQVFGIGEAALQKLIDDSFPHWPAEIELGFRAASPLIEIKLTTRSEQAEKLKQQWQTKLHQLLGDHIFNIISDKSLSLAECVVDLLTSKQQKITLAESCTGGLIANHISRIPGASDVFEAGFVTYSNQMKTNMLAVDENIFEQAGAVSEACVKAMLTGALAVSGADCGIAVSGIAGPSGGSAEKPVGTICIGWGTKEQINTTTLLIPAKREYFQKYVSAISLDLLRRLLINSKEKPNYITERAIAKVINARNLDHK